MRGITGHKLPHSELEKLSDFLAVGFHNLSFVLMHLRVTEVVRNLINSVKSSIRDVAVEMMLSVPERAWNPPEWLGGRLWLVHCVGRVK